MIGDLNEEAAHSSKTRQRQRKWNNSQKALFQLCTEVFLFFFSFFFKEENLPVFPAAVRLASGLYTEPCSYRQGRVHCLDACRERQGERLPLRTPKIHQMCHS